MTLWRQAFEAFGVGFRLETNRPDCVAPLVAEFPPHRPVVDDRPRTTFRLDFDADGRPQSLLVDGRPPPSELPPEAPLDWQLNALVTWHVAEHSPHVFVHAGVVRYRERGILFPGRSFAGKTTLTAALLACGAEYLSDDFAVIATAGRVLPCPCPLRIRTSSGRIEKSPADFGAVSAEEPVRTLLIVETEYRPGADWRPERLSPGESVLRMFAHAPAARSAPRRVGSVLARVARNAVCLAGPRGDAAETARRILSYCDALIDQSEISPHPCEADRCCLLPE